jgi:hypothetical protein
MVLLRRQAFAALRQMASRQAVLLTPLESSHPRALSSRYRINRVHPALCKKTTFVFSCTSRMPISQLLSFQIHAGMGGYPPAHPTKDAHPEPARGGGVEGFVSRFFSLFSKSFRRNTYKISHKCSFQRTYSNANFFRCNTYKKLGEGVVIANIGSLATPGLSCMHRQANHS